MAKSKYNFDKQLKVAPRAVFKKGLLPLANFFIPLLPKKIDKKQVVYTTFKLGKLPIHVFMPMSTKKLLPCLFYIHGGGFAYKQSFVHYKTEQAYCNLATCVVVGVDYPVLPKAKYPTAVNALVDCYKDLVAHADKLGIDCDKMAIGGDSAGGNLALEVAIAVGKTEMPQPKGLMTVYPVVDNLQNTPSMEQFTDTPLWNAVCNEKMWQWYLDGQSYVSPLQRLDGLTVEHMFVETEQYDCLHDEGVLLYNAAQKYVKDVQLLDNVGTFHGFDVNFSADITQKSVAARAEFLKKCFD